MSARSAAAGWVPQVCEHLSFGGEAPNGEAGNRGPAVKRAAWVREDLAERLRLQRIAGLVHHRGMEIDPTVAGRGENKANGQRVDDRREPDVAELRDGRSHLIEPDNEIEVVVRAPLTTEERVDAPAAVHACVHARRLEGLDDFDRGFGGHHVPTMARMGRCRSPSSSSLS